MRVGGGTSIMPRVAPTLYDFVEADNGEYLEVAEAVFRIFDRQDWLRVNRARARIKVLVDKIGIDEMRKLVEEELQGRLGRRARLRRRRPRLFDVDEEADAPAVAGVVRLARTATCRSSSASARQRAAQRQEGFSRRRRSRSPAAT